ncbi:hypothetical protein LTR56_012753 [Elasticomyces elasticus]|nr:hypothetical protein LTR22_026737 [Elasticomyces elasticus]KAK3639030.1 hypothetical protein LTR56_012753 [Elasticomyces elasticus]KAK4918716.1 hypothetical protein LTR49_013503 [Elasticomyces elasticus]KAK5741429.1 hypothetical protein LTS12_024591 [Elasticomyces elasticus]
MLHEVLLALSGHPSPLFQSAPVDNSDANIHSLLSPLEAALLKSISTLAEQHRQLRNHVQSVESKHQSTVCRAVATAIRQKHLARFQQRILDVESKILTRDATIVGAYDIVPLASIVAEFDDWHRLMFWLWETVQSIQITTKSTSDGCSGAALINHLRAEASTGFPEIESAAIELSRVAESAWLRQLSPWIVHGKLPAYGSSDFFIRAMPDGRTFQKKTELVPGFLSPATASSILFIGTCLHQIRRLPQQHTESVHSASPVLTDTQLASTHLQHLSSLPLPINQAQLSRAVSAIRLSLSQNVLQRLLPMSDITQLLQCLRIYFLLGQSDFVVALIYEAEARLQARQHSMGRLLQQDPLKALKGLTIKDAELHQTLNATWKRLAREEDAEDHVLDFARQHVRLSTTTSNAARPVSADSVTKHAVQVSPIVFNDLLFPTATSLSLDVASPLDLFISPRDVESYAAINAYLLAIKRAQVRLTELWRRTSNRRNHVSNMNTARRTKDARKVWATSSAALHLLSEISAYLDGEVVKGSCDHFESWVEKPTSSEEVDTTMGSMRSETLDVAQRDPETLAAAHRAFLAALTYATLLTDVPYTREVRSLLGNIDALVAFFNNLLDLQQKLIVEDDDGDTGFAAQEESRISLELDRARKKVESDLRSVINRLRQVDHERIGSGRYLEIQASESGGFEPWKGGGVDRLLMKLEFGRVPDGAFDIV